MDNRNPMQKRLLGSKEIFRLVLVLRAEPALPCGVGELSPEAVGATKHSIEIPHSSAPSVTFGHRNQS